MDAYLDSLSRPRPGSKRVPLEELPLFASAVGDGAPKETKGSPDTSSVAVTRVRKDADASVTVGSHLEPQQSDRVGAVHESLADSARHWIDLGKPIAVAVANARGTVTAETFRDEASKRGKLRPADDDRSLSYLAVMFRGLVKEGRLTVARHPNGDAVKRYSKEMGNDQVVYLPKSREAAA